MKYDAIKGLHWGWWAMGEAMTKARSGEKTGEPPRRGIRMARLRRRQACNSALRVIRTKIGEGEEIAGRCRLRFGVVGAELRVEASSPARSDRSQGGSRPPGPGCFPFPVRVRPLTSRMFD